MRGSNISQNAAYFPAERCIIPTIITHFCGKMRNMRVMLDCTISALKWEDYNRNKCLFLNFCYLIFQKLMHCFEREGEGKRNRIGSIFCYLVIFHASEIPRDCTLFYFDIAYMHFLLYINIAIWYCSVVSLSRVPWSAIRLIFRTSIGSLRAFIFNVGVHQLSFNCVWKQCSNLNSAVLYLKVQLSRKNVLFLRNVWRNV